MAALVFPDDFVDRLRHREGSEPPWAWGHLWTTIASAEHAARREAVERWYAELGEPAGLLPVLRVDEHHLQAFHELAVGRALLDVGVTPRYEHLLGGKTPDWTIPADEPGGPLVVEVVTRMMDRDWRRLRCDWLRVHHRLARIPTGLRLRLTDSRVSPPEAAVLRSLARTVRSWASLQPQTGDGIEVSPGITMAVVGRAHPTTTIFEAPSGARPYEIDPLFDLIEGKARRYGPLVEDGTGLLIVVACEAGAGLEPSRLLAAWEGQQTITIGFMPGDTHIAEAEVRLDPTPWKHRLGPSVSAIGWLDPDPRRPQVSVLINPAASVPLELPLPRLQ